MRLPEVPPTYSPEIEKERNRTLEIAAQQYIRTDGDADFGMNPVRATFTYQANNRDFILADTSGGAFLIGLPEPADGYYVIIMDGGGVWGTNNLTVSGLGEDIEGSPSDLVCDLDGWMITLAYDGSGWRVYP